MATTGGFALPTITEASAQKFQQYNDGIDQLDRALTTRISFSLASGNATATLANVREHQVIALTGAAAAGRTLTLPVATRLLLVTLDGASAHDVGIVLGATTVTVSPGQAAFLYCDGSANGLAAFGFGAVTGPVAYSLPIADASTLGGVKDGTGVTISGSGVLSVDYGTTAGTAAAGNDSRITGAAAAGAVGSSGMTMTTARLLGRTTASTGAIEEITVGSGLSLSGGALTATAGGGTVTSVSGSGGSTGLTLTGGAITTSGTLTLGGTLAVANGGTGQTTAALGANALLAGLSTTQGAIAYRDGSAWAALAPGTAGQVLQSGGAAANPSWAAAPYDIALFVESTMTNSEQVLRFICPRAISIASGASGNAKAGTAATGSTTLTIAKNGSSIGTLVWSAAGTAATVSITSTTAFAVGDVLSITGPATADATLADIAITLTATRS